MDNIASYVIPKDDLSHSPEKANFGRLDPPTNSFSHDPPFIAIGESRNRGQLVAWEFCFLVECSLCHNSVVKRAKYLFCYFDSPAHLVLHSHLTQEQNPKIPRPLQVARNSQIPHISEQYGLKSESLGTLDHLNPFM